MPSPPTSSRTVMDRHRFVGFKDAVVAGHSFGDTQLGTGTAQTAWSASFALSNYPLGSFHPECAAHDTSECLVRVCTGRSAAPVAPFPHAGLVTIAGGKKLVSLAAGAGGSYSLFQEAALLWEGGETLTLKAAGGDVPGFGASVTAPGVATITAPAVPPSNGSLTVTRASGLALSWTGGNTDIVATLQNSTTGNSDPSTTPFCTFPASAKSRTIPAAALAYLPAGPSSTLHVLSMSSTTVTAGDWKVRFEASANALSPAGKQYTVRMTLQ